MTVCSHGPLGTPVAQAAHGALGTHDTLGAHGESQ